MRLRILTIVGAVILLCIGSIVTASTAYALSGPHEGNFALTTNACAGCHRAHTAKTSFLLKVADEYELCTTCHDGSGADTKVTTGQYIGTTQGTNGAGLRGGGFEKALMNTSLSSSFDPTGAPQNVTSKHSVGATGTAWGSGTTAGNGTDITLDCTNCHNPHGNANYRLLRPQPTSGLSPDVLPWSGTGKNVDVPITVGVTDVYTIAYNGGHYRDITGYTTGIASQMANWCGQCHTRYKALAGSGSSSTGTTAPFLYRHMTDGLTGECLSCHVAHGTSASMTGAAAGPAWPGGAADVGWQTGTEGQYSRLLSVDNRGVCIQCHSELTTGN
jgi:predicted CXXCH cytochrome family protein